MSIALWKTVLGLAKAVAVLIILAAGFFFWSHRSAMAKTWAAPNFAPEARVIRVDAALTGNLSIPLGRFERVRPPTEAPVEEKKEDNFAGVLAQLGEITDAIVFYGPPEEGGLAPAIIFKFKVRPAGETSDSRTIRLGEALIDKPHPQSSQHRIPSQFKFVGCERDPANPLFTFFLFDVKCDGLDIQKARWKLEEPVKEQPKPVEGGPTGPADVRTDKMYVGGVLSSKKIEEPAPEKGPVQVEPVAPAPVPDPIEVEQAPTGTLFEEEEGILAPTAEGVDYLERNYEKILEETRTESYRDRDGRTGVRVVGISNASVANQFGIMKDDVILKINGRAVATQAEAVNAVKDELKKRPAVRVIRVTIRRRGRELEKSFDTRDPATRRAAKRAFK